MGKESSLPCVYKVRLISPQPSVMELIDAVLALKLFKFLERSFTFAPDIPVFVGARPRTQPLDITHTLQSVVEKGLDMESQAALGQQDILQFYDNLPMMKLFQWLLAEGAEPGFVCAIFRHQLLPTVSVTISGSDASQIVRNRCSGGLTGTRVAGALGRILVEQCFKDNHKKWNRWAFRRCISAASFVDNIFVFRSPRGEPHAFWMTSLNICIVLGIYV